jgi:hypothetical protein
MASESLFMKCSSCGKEILKSEKRCPNCGKKLKSLTLVHWIGITIGGLFVIGFFNSPQNTHRSEIKPVSLKQEILKEIKLSYNWQKTAFGAVMEANFTIINNSDFSFKDIEIECDHYAKSGTKIDSNNRTIYEIFEAKTSKSYPNFNMGFIHEQANTSTCFIKDISLVN